MNQKITTICTKAGVFPDLFLSAHAHNYQRYTRHYMGQKIAYIVVGTGGMPLSQCRMPAASLSTQPAK